MRTAFRVSTACSCWAEMVSVKQSISTSSRRMPASRAASKIFSASTNRSSAFKGMPDLSMVSPTTAAPYFFTRGSTLCNTSSSALTEFTMARPLQARSPASMAAGSEESICNGKSTTLCTAFTTSTIIAASSNPGTPTLMSKISAPASACSMARSIT